MNTFKTLRALLPWLAIALATTLAITAFSAAVHKAFERTYQRGHTAGAHSVQQRWNAHLAETEAKVSTLERLYREREHSLLARLDQLDTTHQEELARVQREKDHFAAGVRAGRIRLSIPVAAAAPAPACPAHHSAAATDPAPAGPPQEARAELAPAAAQALVAIADDGDSAIRDLNACIDRYATVRATLNDHVQSP